MQNKATQIQVTMLGGFSLEYDGNAFTIERNSITKVNQLLQMLLYFPEGLHREQLITNLFDNDTIADTSNSLRALVFRLRKILPAAGLPDDEYVHISRGNYSWTSNIPIECDAHEFEKLCRQGLEEISLDEKKKSLRQAFELYKGEFLPQLSEEWAIAVQVRLRKLYCRCVEDLCEIYLAEGDFEELLNISKRASEMYSLNEWQSYEMQALIGLGRNKEALKLYDETEKLMFDELGVTVSSKMSALLDRLGQRVKNTPDVISNVQKNIESAKEDLAGAFRCTYPIFTETYRYMKRVIRRTGQSAWLMLCTITDGKGYALDESERLYELSEELDVSIKNSLRGGDMYAKYSDNQFIVFLLGITQEDCSIVQERINTNMAKDSRKKYLLYNVAPVGVSTINSEGSTQDLNDLVRGNK